MIRYKQLAEEVVNDIASGRLAIGARVPSVRQFSKEHKVSMTTALNCYNKLHEQGWLRVKAQSGYYVSQPLIDTNKPTFPAFNATITEPKGYVTEYDHSIENPFHIAQIAGELIPREVLNRCFHRGNLRSFNNDYLYPKIQGQLNLRRTLAEHVSSHYFSLAASDLVITNGCIDAIRSAIEAVSEVGDTIAVSSPCFSGLLNLLLSMKRKVLEVSCHNGDLDLVQLELFMNRGLLKAGLFSANFINPHGLCLSVAQKQALVALAERYQLPIIEDDAFLELGFDGVHSKPIKYWDQHGWVIWCGSISKTVAPSYRLGWCAPGRFAQQYMQQRSVNSLFVNVPIQAAFFEFINSGQYQKHLKKIRVALAEQTQAYHRFLQENLPAYIQLSALQGGMVIWLQIKGLDAAKLAIKALEHGVSFRLGEEFSTRGLYQDCFRLNAGWPISHVLEDGDSVEQKLALLCQLINQQLALNNAV
ncbi:PLP-dependent aminotransferase family protein [Gammaproteobacteria bacterium AS21]